MVLCLWSLGLDPWPYAYQVGAAFAYVPVSCVYICTYLRVHVGVDTSVPVWVSDWQPETPWGVVPQEPSTLFLETVFFQELGLADYTRLASWSASEPQGPACLPPQHCGDMGMSPCLAFFVGAGDGAWVFSLVGTALNSLQIPPLFLFSEELFCKLCKMRWEKFSSLGTHLSTIS